MRLYSILIMVLLCLLTGCASVTGPISGKKYTMYNGVVLNWPEYEEEVRQHRQKERESYVNAHPELPENIKDCIINQKITLGMTAEQLELSWGKPEKINTSVGSYGRHEQWVYYGDTYVYVENGRLTSWQD